jgi:hypothetical protein
MLSPRYHRIRLLIEMFPYSTVVLADNENFRLTVCVTTTSPLIEAHDAVRREVGTCEPARAGDGIWDCGSGAALQRQIRS